MKKVFLLLLILPFFFACKDDASSSSEPETKPKPAPVGCSIDTDCDSGKICKNGTCIKQASCGDGIVDVDNDEECDDGQNNGSPSSNCSSACKVINK